MLKAMRAFVDSSQRRKGKRVAIKRSGDFQKAISQASCKSVSTFLYPLFFFAPLRFKSAKIEIEIRIYEDGWQKMGDALTYSVMRETRQVNRFFVQAITMALILRFYRGSGMLSYHLTQAVWPHY
jgi:hypothetical protein